MKFFYEDLEIYYEDSQIDNQKIQSQTNKNKCENLPSQNYDSDTTQNINEKEKNNNKDLQEIPILFLHGWEGSTLSFKIFYEAMKTNHRCINLDFPPFGKSSFPKKPLSVPDYSKMVLALLDYLEITKVNIVAHSFGGRVAIELASKTKIINKLLLTGSAGLKKRSIKKILKIKIYKLKKFLAKIKLFPQKLLENKGSCEYNKLDPIMKQTFINIVNYNQKKLLPKINVPTLLIWGINDKETPFCFTKVFKNNIKDCEIIKFENCSHFAYLEKPQTFLKIMQAYF